MVDASRYAVISHGRLSKSRKVAADGRQRGRDDGLVQRRDEHRQTDADDDRLDLGIRHHPATRQQSSCDRRSGGIATTSTAADADRRDCRLVEFRARRIVRRDLPAQGLVDGFRDRGPGRAAWSLAQLYNVRLTPCDPAQLQRCAAYFGAGDDAAGKSPPIYKVSHDGAAASPHFPRARAHPTSYDLGRKPFRRPP